MRSVLLLHFPSLSVSMCMVREATSGNVGVGRALGTGGGFIAVRQPWHIADDRRNSGDMCRAIKALGLGFCAPNVSMEAWRLQFGAAVGQGDGMVVVGAW